LVGASVGAGVFGLGVSVAVGRGVNVLVASAVALAVGAGGGVGVAVGVWVADASASAVGVAVAAVPVAVGRGVGGISLGEDAAVGPPALFRVGAGAAAGAQAVRMRVASKMKRIVRFIVIPPEPLRVSVTPGTRWTA